MEVETRVGLEVLSASPDVASSWGRCGLVMNQASLDSEFHPSWMVLQSILGDRLTTLFGPQHGFDGIVQDNMVETDHTTHSKTKLPLYSLYSETREPTEEMLKNVDTLIVDLQIVGCRIYTWKSTIAGCLRSAKKYGKKIVVLDRPNPLGGEFVEGRLVDDDATSFVGQFPTPMRHGLTAGESALFFNKTIGSELEVVKLEGWDAYKDWRATGRQWMVTSPNLPTLESVFVYPGMVIFEGTNVSEGRGTARPFQYIGAPYIKDSVEFCSRVTELAKGYLAGLHLHPVSFMPTFHKGKDQICNGANLVVRKPEKISSYGLALSMIQAFMDLGEGSFDWQREAYEYDFKTLPIKLILGSQNILDHFGSSFDVNDPFWNEGADLFIKNAKDILLYDREMKLLVA